MAKRNTPVPAADDSAAAALEASQNQEPAKQKSRTSVILLLLAVLLPAAGGAALSYTQYPVIAQSIRVISPGQDAVQRPIQYGMFTELQNLIVNPAGSNGQRYLIVTIGLESSSGQVLDEIRSKEIVVKDTILKVLGLRTLEELAAIERRNATKEAVREAVNSIVNRGSVDRIYFTQYVLQ